MVKIARAPEMISGAPMQAKGPLCRLPRARALGLPAWWVGVRVAYPCLVPNFEVFESSQPGSVSVLSVCGT